MSQIIKSLSLAFLSIVLFCPRANAQTIIAASCNESDVSTALNSVTADGTTVNIPACTASWASTLVYTANYSMTILGAGNTTGSDSLGNPTGYNDQTILIDNASPNQMLKINLIPSKTFRMTGITFKGGSGATGFNGTVSITGVSTSVRVDHCHFLNLTDLNIEFVDWLYGVADHNIFDILANSANNGIRVEHAGWNNGINGDQSWADFAYFGTNKAIYAEDNTFNFPNGAGAGYSNDGDNGSHIVFRYNTMNNVYFQVHDQTGDNRGPRAFEYYKNVVTYTGTPGDSAQAMFVRDGTGLVWGNTVTGFNGLISMFSDRASANNSYPQAPNGWGYCGTEYNSHGSSVWDKNTNSSGYACIDQVGRGKGDLLTGVFPNKVNSVTNTATWPNQEQEPLYEWLDTINMGSIASSSEPNVIMVNRDYYTQNASFNGTSGTGSGTLAARPSTCTPLVAYFATDTNTLYQCATANTWTVYYKPYTYPHPLTLGSGNPPPAPAAPSNLTATVSGN